MSYNRIPSDNPLRISQLFFETDLQFKVRGIFSLTLMSEDVGKNYRQKRIGKASFVKYLITMLTINTCNPRTTPPPKLEFSGNCKLTFSERYLSFRGTKLTFHFQCDMLRTSLSTEGNFSL